jgi:isopenicillin-N N-acyltransferase like protein
MSSLQPRSNSFFLLMAYALLAFADVTDLSACTLWAAAGERTAHGGSLIAKNRDWSPEPDEVQWVKRPTGFRFLGLFPIRDGKQRNVVAGVNEKGLVVVTASASSVPREEREKGGKNLTQQLLSVFSTVDEVLDNKLVFSRTHPSIYLIADRRKVGWIEVAPEGRFSVRDVRNGVLAHTNHYLDETLSDANGKIGRSSRTRLGRIGDLLSSRATLLTLEDFIVFSQDRNDGPDDSLWRTGSKPERERTLASWIVSLPPAAPPELFLRLANPGESERTMRITLGGPFWKGIE